MSHVIRDNPRLLLGKQLSAAELHALQLLCTGHTTKVIAIMRKTSRRTACHHLKKARLKAGCKTLPELAVWACKNGHLS